MFTPSRPVVISAKAYCTFPHELGQPSTRMVRYHLVCTWSWIGSLRFVGILLGCWDKLSFLWVWVRDFSQREWVDYHCTAGLAVWIWVYYGYGVKERNRDRRSSIHPLFGRSSVLNRLKLVWSLYIFVEFERLIEQYGIANNVNSIHCSTLSELLPVRAEAPSSTILIFGLHGAPPR
jgi:hypothetical protein